MPEVGDEPSGSRPASEVRHRRWGILLSLPISLFLFSSSLSLSLSFFAFHTCPHPIDSSSPFPKFHYRHFILLAWNQTETILR